MKKLYLLFALLLSISIVSCSDDDDEKAGNKKDLGGGIYLINDHRFVDLGLPSGLLWAETNIGAKTAADDGSYFAWGETDMVTKAYYHWTTYKYGTSYDSLNKYNSTDGKRVLDKEDDAAYVNWGSSCRMPTITEFTELISSENCTWTWTSMTTSDNSSIDGYKVTSVKNGNSIFLPASGCRYSWDSLSHGSDGHYWSSTLSSADDYCDDAYYLSFDSADRDCVNLARRYGYSIRPVAEP
jgi:hypothetical protein